MLSLSLWHEKKSKKTMKRTRVIKRKLSLPFLFMNDAKKGRASSHIVKMLTKVRETKPD